MSQASERGLCAHEQNLSTNSYCNFILFAVEASNTMLVICACISKPGGTCDYDPDEDMDDDGLCADVDPCALDAENDVDNDQICGDVDPCPHDPENDVDSDRICRDKDICPVGNDADSDNVCTDVDTCPADPDNDIDSDQLCRNVDSCPLDPENDGDSDSLCRAADPCPNDRKNDEDSDGLCGNSDACAQDAENDADSDQVCGDVDSCVHDAENDADSDRMCGDVDTCPFDPENDEDSDRLCSNDESCGSKFIRITDGTCNSNGYRNVFPGQCAFAANVIAQRCTGSTRLISDLGQPTGCFHPSETTPIYNVATILSNAQPFTTDRPGLCKCSRQTCSDGHVEIYTGSCESNGWSFWRVVYLTSSSSRGHKCRCE